MIYAKSFFASVEFCNGPTAQPSPPSYNFTLYELMNEKFEIFALPPLHLKLE